MLFSFNYFHDYLLCSVLLDLGEALDALHDQTQKNAISWLVKRCGELHPTCAAYVQLRSNGKDVPKEGSMEERKRKARERAMKAMKLSAIKFSAHLEDEEKEKEGGRKDGEEMSSVTAKIGEQEIGLEGDKDKKNEELSAVS